MSDVQPLQPGDPGRLGDHQLEGRLGEGRRGVVFQGLHGDVPVAVKLLHSRLGGDPEARGAFLREAMAGRRVSGSRTARPIGADVAGDWPFLVTDLVAGPPLQQMLVQSGRGDRTTVERLAVGIALALAQLHKAGITHLDLKPTNVLIAHDGPVLTDVGVVRSLTAAGLPPEPGVPAYQAPEQLGGAGAPGPSSDMWAWAAIVATAASGRPPFGEDGAETVADRVLRGEPELHKLPDSVRDMVVMALNKDPFRRPTAEMVLQTLLRRGLPLPASQQTEARDLLNAPAPEDPWSAESTLALPALEPALPAGPAAPERPADPFSGPYLPPAPDRDEWPEPEPLPNMTAAWNGPPPVDVRTPAAARQDQRMIKGLGALVIGVVVGIIVITLLWNGAEKDEPKTAQSGTPSAPSQAAFSGTWRGTATNQAGVQFSIVVTFADAEQATAKLGVGNCTGRLTRTGGSGQEMRMSFTRTKGHCSPGDVTVKDAGDGSLFYSWAKPGGKHHYEATLKRE